MRLHTIPGDCDMCKQWRPLLKWAKMPDPRPLAPAGTAVDLSVTITEARACMACGPLWVLSDFDVEMIKRRLF